MQLHNQLSQDLLGNITINVFEPYTKNGNIRCSQPHCTEYAAFRFNQKDNSNDPELYCRIHKHDYIESKYRRIISLAHIWSLDVMKSAINQTPIRLQRKGSDRLENPDDVYGYIKNITENYIIIGDESGFQDITPIHAVNCIITTNR